MKYLILTGASRGVGEGIIRSLKNENIEIFAIARNSSTLSEDLFNNLSFFSFDLNNIDKIDSLMNNIFSKIILKEEDEIYLINNAGIIAPSVPTTKLVPEELTHHFNVNTLAPMLICSNFIHHTENFKGVKRILNISSGAAVSPIYGWGPYSASKSALDAFSKVVKVEEDLKDNGVEIMVLYPGVVDTDLQKDIRSLNKENFAMVDTFKGYKENGVLLTKEKVGQIVSSIIQGHGFKNGEVVKISEYIDK